MLNSPAEFSKTTNETVTIINNSATFLSVFLFYFSRILENFSHLTFTCSDLYRVNSIYPLYF